VNRSRGVRAALVAAVVAALTVTVAGPAAAEPSPGRPDDRVAAETSLLAALRRDLHLSAAQARRLLVQQAGVDGLAETMSARLGPDYGGAWFDQRTGKLVVAATGPERAALARSARTETRVVRYSLQTLRGIMATLDAAARQDQRRMSAAISWAVDVQRNQVVVNVHKGQAGALGPLVAAYGDAVSVQESTLNPVLTTDFLDGGDPFNGCSVGFNVTKDGVGHFLTAGHCGKAGDNVQSGGVFVGSFVQSFFPFFDDALVRVDNTALWTQGGWVFAYTDDPGIVYRIAGYRDSPVGTAVCKSGRTSKVTCGTVTGKDETVNAFDGTGRFLGPVTGMTRDTACAEPGDSGGSNFSITSDGNFAEGMSSISDLTADGRCREKVGGQSTMWFFPVADSIAFYGVTLMTR
jgi:streptogrisin C